MREVWFLPPTPHSKAHWAQGSPLGSSPQYRSEQKGKPGLRARESRMASPFLPQLFRSNTHWEVRTRQPDVLLTHRFQLWSPR